MGFWANKRVVVTGGSGFLGSYVVEHLREKNAAQIFVPRSRDCDLRQTDQVARLLREAQPDIVFHLAAFVGGIGANLRYPARLFYDNAIMGVQLIEHARLQGVEKFVCIGTACSYPKDAGIPFCEADLWNGYPETTNAPYGLAKRMLLVQLQAYRQQYGFNGIYLIPVNLYGPRDNFDPENSHVIPALIRKCVEARRAGRPKIVAWGTGEASREFLYVQDAAEAIVMAAEAYEGGDPVNLGSGEEVRIRDLVESIKSLAGYEGEVEWDTTKPDGQPRRMLDTHRALQTFGWKAHTPLREGLQRTVAWFNATYST